MSTKTSHRRKFRQKIKDVKRRKKRSNKKEALDCHVWNRSLKRCKAPLDEADREAIIQMIQRGEAECVFSQSRRKSHFKVRYNAEYLVVIYDNKRKALVTVLPPHVAEEQ